jgi:malonyl-CoA O-methyltransferase
VNWLRRLLGNTPIKIERGSALEKEIRKSFEESAHDEEHFPSTIDPRIAHVQLVVQHLSPCRRVLDLGSGKGRFARIVKQHNPEATVVCFDLALNMLRYCDKNLAPCAGSMTELPFAPGSFDAVYATESLEHAIDIEAAIGEMCQVLAPGGRLVIIDKNAEHWGKLKTPQWEQWFHRGQLEELLRHYCTKVESRPISYWDDVPPDGLFLAWTATK